MTLQARPTFQPNDPTERAALIRVALSQKQFKPWHCLTHSVNLSEKAARVFHAHCDLIGRSGHYERLTGSES